MWYSMDFKGIDRDKGKWKCSVLLLRRYWMPVAMIINSSELRAAGFALREVFLQKLEAAARRSCTRGVGVRHFQGLVHKPFMLSVDDGTEFGSRCHRMYICVLWCVTAQTKNYSKNVIKSPPKKSPRAPSNVWPRWYLLTLTVD